MSVAFKKAERSQSKLRIGLAGPSGAGKTMSSLKLARGIVGPKGRIALIDTERGSAALYAHVTDFDVLELKPPFAPKNYIEAIEAAEDAGYDIVIVDSLTHAWADEGGILDQADKLEKAGKNRFTMWADLTPQHRQLVNSLLNCDVHLIGCVRSKQEYALDKDQNTGKSSVKKLGMAPIQREGMEYEFTTFFDIAQNHIASASKDRTDLFKNELFMINENTGERLINWLNEAKAPEVKAPSNAEKRNQVKEGELLKKKDKIMKQLKWLRHDPKTGDEVAALVKEKTGCDLLPENFDEISGKLQILVDELPPLAPAPKVAAQPAPAPAAPVAPAPQQ